MNIFRDSCPKVMIILDVHPVSSWLLSTFQHIIISLHIYLLLSMKFSIVHLDLHITQSRRQNINEGSLALSTMSKAVEHFCKS